MKTSNKKIIDLLKIGKKLKSLELSPNENFDFDVLDEIKPDFCSVTWLHNFKNTPEDIPPITFSKELVDKGYSVLLHLPGRHLDQQRVLDILNEAKKIGVKNIFALKGQHTLETDSNQDHIDFPYAADLVDFIKKKFGNHFDIGVTGYPDKHPTSKTLEDDMKYLKEKVSKGADFIITQASFEYEIYQKFTSNCKRYLIDIPIIPGVYIINSYESLIFMKDLSKIPVDEKIINFVTENKADVAKVTEYGKKLSIDLIEDILYKDNCLKGVHIFTMNKLELTKDVLKTVKDKKEAV